MAASVVIRGDGVAASCCTHLLQTAGFHVTADRVERPQLPAIMLNGPAVALIEDIFGQKDLFRNAHRIRKRVVAWGPESKPVELDHSAVVVSEQALLKSIRSGVPEEGPIEGNWTIFASRPLPSDISEHRFGSRTASAVPVEIKNKADSEICWIESVGNGWLFLVPDSLSSAWLLSVGGPAARLLDQSRVIVNQVRECGPANKEFPAYPRISSPLCAQRWLSCGTSAMTFDPICGDGTANAIREAILACAVIRAADSTADGDPRELFSHYEARLIAGFRRSLVQCHGFYKSGHISDWWTVELKSIEEGLAWCDHKLRSARAFRYRLNGFELQRVTEQR